jgi:small subunit ribosomal protein S2
MAQVEYKELLDAGVHFGHLTRKWDPRMAPYIFMEKNGIHVIDLNKTLSSLEQAQAFVKGIVRSGKKIMFVATKKQAQEIVSEEARRLKMPYVTDRWLGGMLTNYATIKKSLKKMGNIERMLSDETTAKNIAKRERLMMERERIKLDRLLGGVADMSRLPSALFIVDVKREHLAVAEATRLGIPIVALCDTNSNPESIDYPIPANDDAYKSVSLLTIAIGKAIEEGILERKQDKEEQAQAEAEAAKRAVDEKRAADEVKAEARAAAKAEKEAAKTESPKSNAAKTASVSDASIEVKEAVEETVAEVKEAVAEKAPEVKKEEASIVESVVETVKETTESVVESAKETVAEVAEAVGEVAEEVADATETTDEDSKKEDKV